MNRTTLSLIGAATALAAVTGVASLATPGAAKDTAARTASRLPVERSTLLCPAPTSSELGRTTYSAFAPQDGAGGRASKGSAELLPAAHVAENGQADKGKTDDKAGKNGKDGKNGDAEPVVPLREPGKPVTASADGAEAPALSGTADGRLAPGWTVQQTSEITAGVGRGLAGTACTPPDTEFWFPGASTAKDRQDYAHLTNPDDTAAVVDLELYGKDGAIKAPTGEGITIPAHSSVSVLLSTMTSEPTTNVTVHALARAGRVGASVQSVDAKLGGDWLPAAADPSADLVLPGIPADATSVRLVAFATGEDDADLKVRLTGPNGSISPAGHETLHVKSRMTAAVDLGDVTKGEAGSLVLTPTASGGKTAPVVAALRVTRGKGSKQETAFIPATGRIETRAAAVDNRAKGSTLSLVAPGKSAKVKVTASAGSQGGTPVSKTYTVKGGTTLAVDPPRPAGLKGGYALTVQPLSGGPVHAARTLALPQDGIPMFTVQTLPDDRGTVAVPKAGQDLKMMND
ncbi:DUF5719 family protein [Streptomyces sp. H27-D2]|uniref:DUF5719 family protein n=1 Tax=Streptomyces sp. H27-D2 TaxID=3046304 RepID=UPI002DBE12B5|nr:DUF5719 family protein [Streptomyces sp. H27-D2]MEC4020927.1 DUF5719 family protein [Streptomyces sp. H27-D2]